jgi:hypothetical protein
MSTLRELGFQSVAFVVPCDEGALSSGVDSGTITDSAPENRFQVRKNERSYARESGREAIAVNVPRAKTAAFRTMKLV